jgi:hypothetical protein
VSSFPGLHYSVPLSCVRRSERRPDADGRRSIECDESSFQTLGNGSSSGTPVAASGLSIKGNGLGITRSAWSPGLKDRSIPLDRIGDL